MTPDGYDWFAEVVEQITGYRDELHAPDGQLAQMRATITATHTLMADYIRQSEDHWRIVMRELAATRSDMHALCVRVDAIRLDVDHLRDRVERLEAHHERDPQAQL